MPLVRRSTQLLVATLVALVALGSLGGCKKKEAPPEGDVAATIAGVTLDGAQFEPSLLKGKPSIVMFVSPTCPHCLDEIPAADKVAKEKDANVVAVFVVDSADKAKGVVESTKFAGHAVMDDGTLKKLYGIRTVPYTLVLGADGHAREAFRGAQTYDRLAEAVADAR